MGHKTALYEQHLALNARIVDFGGWDMPVQYSSVLAEHHAVRQAVGMFDVSHMTFLELTGTDAIPYLQRILANDVTRLAVAGKALYSAMLNEQGGIIDDLIVYAPTVHRPNVWRIIVNCGTHDKDLAWMQQQAQHFAVNLIERTDLAMLAVQGPTAYRVVSDVLGAEAGAIIQALKVFQGREYNDWFIARTGYTGEEGLEILLPNTQAAALWQQLLAAHVVPCGLAARDTLRLEAGMNLYGNDMTEETTPLVSNMAWTVTWGHDFIGKPALVAQKEAGVPQQLVGLVLLDKGVLRAHQKVIIDGVGEGETTSGTFSPTMDKSIALARIPAGHFDHVWVEIRGKRLAAKIVKPPFVRLGKVLV
ncbi:glycine cleavage system aminomethyltransferase GcvT [Agitococcus lubricus]|uniref:Aminomethyltransferase n=1 Tax=Agitococcus lubricus TaxID=1077255 RepID=A0A2T5IZP7_9GAMM|nr:glycine cleavage system aminomethyltransferase GcvT [Agitococcus lubricus]PTQ89537.1 aminomethyltransferase [Agitococcus lubricus]